MRIAIDACPLSGNVTGIGRYILQIFRELDLLLPDAEFLLYSPSCVQVDLPSDRWRVRVGGSRMASSYVWLKTSARSMAIDDGAEIFWATRAILPGRTNKFKTVSTVHDLNYRICPESMPHIALLAYRLWFLKDIRRADAVVANSQGTASKLYNFYGINAFSVARPGVADCFGLSPRQSTETKLREMGVSGPYFLAVGTLEPRKNISALVEAFVSLKRANLLAGYELILAGGRGWKDRALRKMLSGAGEYGVRSLGYVTDEDLASLYTGAAAFVFPSIYEGFGIPAAEARACGARLVVTDLPELHEAAGMGAIYIDPTIAGIRDGLLRAIGGPYATEFLHPKRGWDEAARAMAKVFLHVLAD